tara:strand:+ start:237 stop:416 length:180 start_codon:yes stop_codon:yes gene_type:complete
MTNTMISVTSMPRLSKKSGTYPVQMSKTENLFFFVFEEQSEPKMTEMAIEVITIRGDIN